MPKVMIGPAPLARLQGDFLTVLGNAGFEFVYPKVAVQMTEQDLLDQLNGIPASLAGSEPYTRKVFEKFPQLKVVARVGVGYDAVDVQAATDHGVVVTIAPGTNQDAVAEHCFMLILALAKNLMRQHQPIRDGKWPRQANLPLRGKTLGIVGLGRIGKSMTTRALAFGMTVIAHRRTAQPSPVPGVELVDFDALLARSDHLVIAAPATRETHHVIDRGALARTQRGVHLVNVARGDLVDQDALRAALDEGQVSLASLDTVSPEPLPAGHWLFTHPRVRLSPHCSWSSPGALDRLLDPFLANLARFLEGSPLEEMVDVELGY